MKNRFLIYALIGISGVGKSYLTKYALEKCQNNLEKLVAVTTRGKRRQEKDGIDKYFFSDAQFEAEKGKLVLVRRMYGANYGFREEDFDKKRNLIAELYYKDYLQMKKEGYPVKGIYIWTSEHRHRRELVKRRYDDSYIFLKREMADVCNNLIHKVMLGLGLFDYSICNHYDEISEIEILNIVDSKGKTG